MPSPVTAFALAAALFAAACSSSSSAPCAAEATITVQVTDEDVDDPSNYICNATVTITEGASASDAGAPLTAVGTDGSNANCVYVVNEPPGTYTLTASKAGYMPLSETITVVSANCVATSQNPRLGLFESQQMTPEAGLPDVNVFRTPDAGAAD